MWAHLVASVSRLFERNALLMPPSFLPLPRSPPLLPPRCRKHTICQDRKLSPYEDKVDDNSSQGLSLQPGKELSGTWEVSRSRCNPTYAYVRKGGQAARTVVVRSYWGQFTWLPPASGLLSDVTPPPRAEVPAGFDPV